MEAVNIFQQKFDKLILMKIATRCHILKLNAPNSTSAGTPLESLLQHSPDSLAGFKGPTSDGRGGSKGRARREKKGAEERRGAP